jgi:hypothetical protein
VLAEVKWGECIRFFDDSDNAEEVEAEGIRDLFFIELRTEQPTSDPTTKNLELNFSKA